MVLVFISIILVSLYSINRNFKIILNFSLRYIDYFISTATFVAFSLQLVEFNSEGIKTILSVCSFVSSFILPGWLMLRVLKIVGHLGLGNTLILAFLFSIGVSSLIYVFIISINEEPSSQSLSMVYLTLGIILILRNYIGKSNHKTAEIENKITLSLLNLSTVVLLTVFFCFVIFSLYPSISNVPALDIVRHYGQIKALETSPEIFRSEYPWFHFSLAVLNELTHLPMSIFQTIISLLSVVMIYSFYSMSKIYLTNVHRYAHLISTIVFTIFSGFGWIYFVQKLPDHYDQNVLVDIFNNSYIATYYDIGLGQSSWLWLWFRPVTLGFTIIFILFYLLRIENLSKKVYIFLNSFLLLILSLVHIPELLIFTVIILVISIFLPRINLRLKETSVAIIAALIFYSVFNIMYQIFITKDSIVFYKEISLLLIIIPVVSLILLKYPRRLTLPLKVNKEIIISIVLFIYGSVLIYWLLNYDLVDKGIRSIFGILDLYAIPLAIYPPLLGIAGILAIPAAVILLISMRNNPIILFPIVITTVFLLGKLVTYINISFEDVDYWERRLIPYLWMGISVLSAMSIVELHNFIKKIRVHDNRFKFLKPLSIGITVTFILLCGTLSTFLTIDYRLLLNQLNGLTVEELNLQNSLSKVVDENSTLLSLSPRSSSILEYLISNYNINYYKNQIWPSESPEFPLSILGGLNNSAIIFLSQADLNSPELKTYRDSYVASHLMRFSSEVQNNGSLIAKIPPLNPPSSNSDIVLVLSDKPYNKQNFAYDILSLGRFNYTTADLYDLPLIRNAETIIAPNFEVANIISKAKSEYNFKFQNIIILNMDGQDPAFKVNSEPLSKIINNQNKTEFGNALDLSRFQYLTLNWYGSNSNEDYILNILLQNGKQLTFSFKDTWMGWKEILFDINAYLESSVMDQTQNYRNIIEPNSLKVSRIYIEPSQNHLRESTESNWMNTDLDPSSPTIISNLGLAKDSKSETSKILSSKTNKTLDFPSYLNTMSVTTDPNFDILAQFDNGVPFILNKTINNYNSYYVNFYPLIKEIESSNLNQNMLLMLGQVLDFISIDKGTYEFDGNNPTSLVSEGITAFTDAKFKGDINIKARSSIIISDDSEIELQVDGESSVFNNITHIVPLYINKLDVRTNDTEIYGYSGYYTNILLHNSSILNLDGDPVILSLVFDNGEEMYVTGEKMQMSLNKTNLITRQPDISINGIANFTQFYAYGGLNEKFKILGKDMVFDGQTKLKIVYGDNFMISKGSSFEGNIQSPLLNYYNSIEFINLFQWPDIGYIFILASFLIVFNIYRRKLLIKTSTL